MVKTAAAFARHLGVPTTTCDIAAAYLRDKEATPPFGYYHACDLVKNRPAGEPIHGVAVSGDPATGLLLGYVEYFGAVRTVVCLSESYGGSKIGGCHAFTPTTGLPLPLQVSLPLDREEIAAIYAYERTTPQAMAEALGAVTGPAVKRNHEAGLKHAQENAARYAFANCGAKPGDKLTPEQAARLPGLMMKRLMPYLQRHFVPGRRRLG
jgi:hypothetical protein